MLQKIHTFLRKILKFKENVKYRVIKTYIYVRYGCWLKENRLTSIHILRAKNATCANISHQEALKIAVLTHQVAFSK